MVKFPVVMNGSPKLYLPPEPFTVTAAKLLPPETTTLPADVPVKVTAPVPVNEPVLSQLPPTLKVLDAGDRARADGEATGRDERPPKVCVPPVPLLSSELPASVLISGADSTRL